MASALLLGARPALADVKWSAPSTCPTEGDVNARARAAVSAGAKIPDAAVQVRKDGDHFVAELVFAEGGSRTFDGETCTVIADAVALVLSMNAAREETPLAPAPPKVAEPRAPVAETTRGFVGLAPLVDLGTLPTVGLGLSLKGGVAFPHARIEGALYGLLPGEKTAVQGVKGTFGALGGAVRAGWLFGAGGARVGPALGLAVERWSGKSVGAVIDGNASAIVVAPELSLAADFRVVPSFHLVGVLGARVPFNAPPFVVSGIGEVHRANSVLARLEFGAEWRF